VKIALLAHLHHPIAEPFQGGIEMHTAIVADELVLRGHDVTLFAKAGSATRAKLAAMLPADFIFGQAKNARGQDISNELVDGAAIEAIRLIKSGGFDLVFNNSLGPLPYTELTERPMITVLHTPPTLERVNAVICQPDWAPGSQHGFVCVSEHTSESWRAMLPQVECIPNGIYLDQWRDSNRAEPDLAVWSARITPEKGLHLAIEAARKAGMRLEFSGPVANRSYYETEVVPLLDKDIIHRGHLDHSQLAAQLSRGQVFVSSSLWAEPFGLALVEAMACGTPVAAFPNGAASEVVDPRGGAIATECSPVALAEAMLVARELDRGVVRASAHRYDAKIMVDRYEEVMQRLAG
jgi:glycosyltransferase involved in cell wall biosynthesis